MTRQIHASYVLVIAKIVKIKIHVLSISLGLLLLTEKLLVAHLDVVNVIKMMLKFVQAVKMGYIQMVKSVNHVEEIVYNAPLHLFVHNVSQILTIMEMEFVRFAKETVRHVTQLIQINAKVVRED